MSGAFFILAINLVVTGLLAAAFLAIAAFDRARSTGRWLAGAYAAGVVYYGIELAIRLFALDIVAVTLGAAVLLGGLTAFNIGVARHYGVRPAVLPSLAVVVGGTIVTVLVDDLPRLSLERMLAYQMPYALMQAIAACTVARARRKHAANYVLVALLSASAAQFVSKPFIANAVGGWGARPSAYLDSSYALISQSLATVFALGIALALIVTVVRVMMVDATIKSETDTLSGLLNRRGFELRAMRALEHAHRVGLPVSAVVCDLDHFKAVNDTYGHATGDRVLIAFADFLRQALAHHHVAGRIGGEEFAILLPGANLGAARLFAEGTRTVFATCQIEGLPDGHRCTASFGIAELRRGETLGMLMARADSALYAAKRAGRDRVHTAEVRPDGAVHSA